MSANPSDPYTNSWSFDDSQSMSYLSTNSEPLFKSCYGTEVNLEWALHVVDGTVIKLFAITPSTVSSNTYVHPKTPLIPRIASLNSSTPSQVAKTIKSHLTTKNLFPANSLCKRYSS